MKVYCIGCKRLMGRRNGLYCKECKRLLSWILLAVDTMSILQNKELMSEITDMGAKFTQMLNIAMGKE